MSMHRVRFLSLAVLALLLGGCGSTPPIDYYLLSANAPAGRGASSPSIGIAELQVAEYLQRPEIVMMETPIAPVSTGSSAGQSRLKTASAAPWR